MNRFRAAVSAILVVLALPLVARLAAAGSFFYPADCQVASTDPVRYRLRFRLYDGRFFGPLCDMRLDPIQYAVFPPRTILGGLAPSKLHFSIDAAGSAHFTPTSCLPDLWAFGDSLFVIVDYVPAYFHAVLITTGGVEVHTDFVQYSCDNPVGVGPGELPDRLWLAAPSPNPARDGTTAQFGLPRAGRVRAAIYDISGRRRRTLIDESLPAGAHTIAWNFRDDRGQDTPPGLYVLRLDADGTVLTRRIIRAR